jgi:23S rRNA (cytidine2498-2'-O)-methyltransferase
MIASAYLAAEGLENTLAEELGAARRDDFGMAWPARAVAGTGDRRAPGHSMSRTDPREIEITSVKSRRCVAGHDNATGRPDAVLHHRRMALIADRLPPVKARPLQFPEPPPSGHLGAWTLLAPDRMLASPTKTSPFVNGERRSWRIISIRRAGPTSSCGRPGPASAPGRGRGISALDLGASPGVLDLGDRRTLGATVTAIDKADLHPRVAAMPGVALRRESAFALPPEKVDWLFSDIIAYPDRAARPGQGGAASPPRAGRIPVCTVKFQRRRRTMRRPMPSPPFRAGG